MQKRLNKIIISALLSAALMIAAHAVLAHVNESMAASASAHDPDQSVQAHHDKHHHGKLGLHKAAYMLLLSEKFTPNELEDWKQALQEHRQLKAQWKEKIEKMNEAEKQEMKKQMKKHWKERSKAVKSLHKQFTKAIETWMENGSTAEVSKVMPEMLKMLKEYNQQLAKRLS